MFDKKKSSLIQATSATKPAPKAGKVGSKNAFINKSLRKAATTNSLGNGATKMTTTDNDFVDQFGKITNYKAPRSYADIAKDMSTLWAQNPRVTICLTFFIRMITRVVSLFDGKKTESTQRGQGLKHEGIMRMIWIHMNYTDSFWKNIALFISIGSWKDIFVMLSYDLQYNGWDNRKLDWDSFGELIMAGLENPKTSNLVKKYLPQIRANSQCKTIEAQADNLIAKWLCSKLFGNKEFKSEGATYKAYRKIKTSGNAHTWQQLISKGKMLEIKFDTIHGRALAQLVSGKFLKNNKLEAEYQKWISSKPVAKFTGFVTELFQPLGVDHHDSKHLQKYQIDTINKQFEGLIETAKKGMKEGENSLIVVVDSSASMSSKAPGGKSSAYIVAKTMALYFSHLLKGPFADYWLEFSNETILKKWQGDTPVAKLVNERSRITAGTNFRSVGTHFVRMLKQGVPEADFPTGILCISDGCFDNTAGNKSETSALRADLKKGGFSKEFCDNFKIILWDIPNEYYNKKGQTAFEDFADSPNLFYLSGYDGSSIAFVTGTEHKTSTPKNAEELFEAAMDQEILNLIEV